MTIETWQRGVQMLKIEYMLFPLQRLTALYQQLAALKVGLILQSLVSISAQQLVEVWCLSEVGAKLIERRMCFFAFVGLSATGFQFTSIGMCQPQGNFSTGLLLSPFFQPPPPSPTQVLLLSPYLSGSLPPSLFLSNYCFSFLSLPISLYLSISLSLSLSLSLFLYLPLFAFPRFTIQFNNFRSTLQSKRSERILHTMYHARHSRPLPWQEQL